MSENAERMWSAFAHRTHDDLYRVYEVETSDEELCAIISLAAIGVGSFRLASGRVKSGEAYLDPDLKSMLYAYGHPDAAKAVDRGLCGLSMPSPRLAYIELVTISVMCQWGVSVSPRLSPLTDTACRWLSRVREQIVSDDEIRDGGPA